MCLRMRRLLGMSGCWAIQTTVASKRREEASARALGAGDAKTSMECEFRGMPITDSGACRSVIPIHADHRFRSMPIAERLSSNQPS